MSTFLSHLFLRIILLNVPFCVKIPNDKKQITNNCNLEIQNFKHSNQGYGYFRGITNTFGWNIGRMLNCLFFG